MAEESKTETPSPVAGSVPARDLSADASAGSTVAAPEDAGGKPIMPWEVIAESLAAQAYRTAHGFGPVEDVGPGPHKARMAQIQRMLAPELKTGTEAVLGWAGISLYFRSVQNALRHVVMGAEVHGPSKGRHNERVLVYSDRLQLLADLVQKEPPTYAQADAWWKDREERLLALAELPRIIAAVEREMGGVPPEAAQHTDVQKIEGMLMGLLGIVAQQKDTIAQYKDVNQRLENALTQKVKTGRR